MRKDGWIMMVFDISGHDFMMLQSALMDEGIEVVTEAPQDGRHAYGSRKFIGHTLFVSDNQKMTAVGIIKQFLEDFQIEKSKFQIAPK